jgi:hypothetical protein
MQRQISKPGSFHLKSILLSQTESAFPPPTAARKRPILGKFSINNNPLDYYSIFPVLSNHASRDARSNRPLR